MLRLHRSAVVAVVSASAGAALYGVAAGGVVAVDDELRAVTPAPRLDTVDFRQEIERDVRPAWDCQAAPRHAPASHDGEV